MLNLNYDNKFDILYARFLSNRDSYGDEDNNGVITYYDMKNDSVTGMAIYDFKKRFESGKININQLPIKINAFSFYINNLLYYPEKGYSYDIQS